MIIVNVLLLERGARELLGRDNMVVKLQNGQANINGLIKKLDEECEGKISRAISRRNISILINGQDIEFLADTNTNLSDGDRVAVIPIVAGG